VDDGQDDVLLDNVQTEVLDRNGKKKKQLGKIKYRVDYDWSSSTLTVTVLECAVRILQPPSPSCRT
jgi:hypothetical protein